MTRVAIKSRRDDIPSRKTHDTPSGLDRLFCALPSFHSFGVSTIMPAMLICPFLHGDV